MLVGKTLEWEQDIPEYQPASIGRKIRYHACVWKEFEDEEALWLLADGWQVYQRSYGDSRRIPLRGMVLMIEIRLGLGGRRILEPELRYMRCVPDSARDVDIRYWAPLKDHVTPSIYTVSNQ